MTFITLLYNFYFDIIFQGVNLQLSQKVITNDEEQTAVKAQTSKSWFTFILHFNVTRRGRSQSQVHFL